MTLLLPNRKSIWRAGRKGRKLVKIGIIGGTGIDAPDILKNKKELTVTTEFGSPSSLVTTGTIEGVEAVIIARHGPNHTLNPTNVPYQANIMAFKKLGCTHILAGTAVGSLKEEIKPGDLIFTAKPFHRY